MLHLGKTSLSAAGQEAAETEYAEEAEYAETESSECDRKDWHVSVVDQTHRRGWLAWWNEAREWTNRLRNGVASPNRRSSRRTRGSGRRHVLLSESLETRVALHSSALITEVMLNPAAPTQAELSELPDLTAADFQFVEIFNSEILDPISLLDMQLAGDIQTTLGDIEVPAGGSALVVANQAAFELRYGDELLIAGEFTGRMESTGARVDLVDEDTHPLQELKLADGDLWPLRARNGMGASLELIDPITTLASQMSKPRNWQGSITPHGTPGEIRLSPMGVTITEAYPGDDAESGLVDQVELWNFTEQPINIAGWYLSDDAHDLLKFQIPTGSVIQADGRLVFSAEDFNPTPEAPEPHHFQLDPHHGGELHLTVVDIFGVPIRYADNVVYGSTSSTSWGRYPDEVANFIPLTEPSFGEANSIGAVGELLITEFNYHPSPPSPGIFNPELSISDLEFVELYNGASQSIDISGWSLAGEIDFVFPADTIVESHGTLVVVPFEPYHPDETDRLTAFTDYYGIDGSVLLIGGYDGQLRDDYGVLRLLEPGEATEAEPDFTPQYLRDQVRYDNVPPWPHEPNGEGSTLTRVAVDSLGDLAESWHAVQPSPGLVPFDPPVQHLLPDLVLWADPLLGVNQLEFVEDHPTTGRKLMRFSTAVYNDGSGPLTIHGGAFVDGARQVTQIVKNADGTTSEFYAGEYVFHPTHNHVHFADYSFYRLREVAEDGTPGDVVAGGDKVSFCLVDSHPFDNQRQGAPFLPVYNTCESATQGISVGWADIYTSELDDQWIDIEDVPAGEYWFETIIDPFNLLLEEDETNNVFRSKVVLHVPEYEPDRFDVAGGPDVRVNGSEVIAGLSIHEPGDTDVFRWTAPRSGGLTVDLALDHTQGDVDLYVWGTDASGEIFIVESVTDSDRESVSIEVVGGKTYFFVAKDLSGNTVPDYELIIAGPGVPADAYESNDSVLEPADLGSGEQEVMQLNLHQPLDQDFFVWTSDQDRTVRVGLEGLANDVEVDLYVHKFDDHSVITTATTPQRFVEFEASEGESYVVVVLSPVNDVVSNYGLKFEHVAFAQDAAEPNDSVEMATDLGNQDVLVEDLNIHQAGNSDFFRWTSLAAGPAVVDLLFSQSDGNLDLALWVDGSNVDLAATDADGETLTIAAEANRAYVLEVRGRDGQTNPNYGLSIDGPETPRIAALRGVKSGGSTIDLTTLDGSNKILPWLDLTQVEIVFTKDVQIGIDDLTMSGIVKPEYAVTDFEYDVETFTAKWTVQSPTVKDRISLRLSNSVVDLEGNRVDGELRALPTGDGRPGGRFEVVFISNPGDFVADERLDQFDIVKLASGIRVQDLYYDLNADGRTDEADIIVQVEVLTGSVIGDSNFDGVFNSLDLITIFQAGQFEDQFVMNSNWTSGDWNGDGEFDSSDLVFAFQRGSYTP